LGTTWKYAKMSDKVRFVNPKKQWRKKCSKWLNIQFLSTCNLKNP
jgi:hypothetical protein